MRFIKTRLLLYLFLGNIETIFLNLIIIFRYISPLSKQYILRLIKLGNVKIKLKDLILYLSQNETPQNELKEFRIIRMLSDNESLIMNEYFVKTLQKIFIDGFSFLSY